MMEVEEYLKMLNKKKYSMQHRIMKTSTASAIASQMATIGHMLGVIDDSTIPKKKRKPKRR